MHPNGLLGSFVARTGLHAVPRPPFGDVGEKKLGLCTFPNLGPRASQCTVRRVKRNGSNIRCQRDRQVSR